MGLNLGLNGAAAFYVFLVLRSSRTEEVRCGAQPAEKRKNTLRVGLRFAPAQLAPFSPGGNQGFPPPFLDAPGGLLWGRFLGGAAHRTRALPSRSLSALWADGLPALAFGQAWQRPPAAAWNYFLNLSDSLTARASARSFSGWPAWPRTQTHLRVCGLAASVRASHRS